MKYLSSLLEMWVSYRKYFLPIIGIGILVLFIYMNTVRYSDGTRSAYTFPSKDVMVIRRNMINNYTIPKNYRPRILVWAKQYHSVDWTFPDLPEEEGGCDISFDRKIYPISDAVVFFMKSSKSNDLPPPEYRRPEQVFVWWSHESPWTVLNYYGHKLDDYNNFFNWTMTYRSNSDVIAHLAPTPALDYILTKLDRIDETADKHLFDHPVMSDDQFEFEFKLLMARKDKFSAWIVSDCNFIKGASKRMDLMNEIRSKTSLNIDEYGKCSGKEIPQNFTILFQTLSSYKFYFAFENAFHCKDYVTEKTLYNGFVAATVPVIYGPKKEDVTKMAPPGSFIHFDDFKDIFALAEYLKKLDADDNAYKKYFEWWKSPGAHVIPRYHFNYGSDPAHYDHQKWNKAIQDDSLEYERFGFYHLCRKLRRMDQLRRPKVIPDLSKVWYGEEYEECMKQ